MKTPQALASLFAFSLLASACGSSPEAAVVRQAQAEPTGRFSSEYCFLNKLASQGMGIDVYTRAALTFNADGTGKSEFRLYGDAACAIELGAGEATTTYSISHRYGDVAVFQVDQLNDPSDPSSVIRYWIPALIAADGLTIDIDYRDGDSAPYVAEPAESDLAAFIADPRSRGVLYARE